jgi:serine protease AprX
MLVVTRRPAPLTLLLALVVALLVGAPLAPVTHRDDNGIVVLVSQLEPSDPRPAQLIERAGGAVLERLSLIDGFSARVPSRVVPALRGLPGIRFVSPNRSVRLLSQYGQDSGVASAIYTDVVRAPRVWAAGVTGAGVNVAVIDTGVNTTGDLAGRVVRAQDFTIEQDNQDSYGHGTFVAGLIAGSGAASSGAVKGVAPGAGIVSLKVAGRNGATDVTLVLAALEWMVTYKDAYNIRVANMSFGFSSSQSYLVDPLAFAVERVWNSGITVVAAAGNTPGVTTSPGNDPFVITAGALNDKTTLLIGDDNVTTFSGGSMTADGVQKPDVYASGRSVVSSRSPGSYVDETYPTSAIGASYGKGSGTSFSTAIVSGVAALAIAKTPLLTPNQVKQRIVSSSRPFGSTGVKGVADAWISTMSLDLTSANVGVTPASGGGSLQATRGAACITDEAGACLSDADADALLGFDPTRYFGDSWAGSQWVGSQWVGSQWVGSQWVGGSGPDEQWSGSQWVGSQWVGSQWVGSQWVGSQWVGGPWSRSAWSFFPET